MARKLYFLVGLAIGYVAGTQASPAQRLRIAETIDRVSRELHLGSPRREPVDASVDPLRRSA